MLFPHVAPGFTCVHRPSGSVRAGALLPSPPPQPRYPTENHAHYVSHTLSLSVSGGDSTSTSSSLYYCRLWFFMFGPKKRSRALACVCVCGRTFPLMDGWIGVGCFGERWGSPHSITCTSPCSLTPHMHNAQHCSAYQNLMVTKNLFFVVWRSSLVVVKMQFSAGVVHVCVYTRA